MSKFRKWWVDSITSHTLENGTEIFGAVVKQEVAVGYNGLHETKEGHMTLRSLKSSNNIRTRSGLVSIDKKQYETAKEDLNTISALIEEVIKEQGELRIIQKWSGFVLDVLHVDYLKSIREDVDLEDSDTYLGVIAKIEEKYQHHTYNENEELVIAKGEFSNQMIEFGNVDDVDYRVKEDETVSTEKLEDKVVEEVTE